jgi:transcriptional regulator with XRE-family HTH domain
MDDSAGMDKPNSQLGRFAGLSPKNVPGHIWPEFFATNRAASDALDQRAMLGRDAATLAPHARQAGRNAQGGSQGNHPAARLDSPRQGINGGLFGYHDRDDRTPTNVMQVPAVIVAMRTIAERLKQAREDRGLTQEQLAKAAGVSQGTIANLEAGLRNSPRKLLNIAEALKVSPRWLESGGAQPAAPAVAAEPRPEYGAKPALPEALPVVLDAMASSQDRDKLRAVLLALLADDAPAYRHRLAELLEHAQAPGEPARPDLAAHRQHAAPRAFTPPPLPGDQAPQPRTRNRTES